MNLLSYLFNRRPAAKQVEADAMPATVTETGAVTGARPMVNNAHGGGYTPTRLAEILEAAEQGDEYSVAEFWKLADFLMEREPQTLALINRLGLAVAGLPHKAEPPKGDTSRRARKIADEVQALLEPGSALRLAAPGLIAQGISHGLSVASVRWDTTAIPWAPVDLVHKPSHFFTFDRTDGRTPLLRSETAGQLALRLEPGLSLAYTPRRSNALQIKNSMAWPLCWIAVLKSVIQGNWAGYLEGFGQPIITARHERNLSPKELTQLQRAVAQLSSYMRGVFNKDIEIDVKELSHTNTEGYERFLRYLDELAAKIVLAGTLTSDSGQGSGSYALGKVHAEGQYDVIRVYANQWAACLQQQLATAYVAWNYGPEAPVPRITVDVEEDEDLVAGAEIVEKLARAGVQLDADEVREKFGFRKPEPGAEVVGGAPAPAAPPEPTPGKTSPKTKTAQAACPVHSAQAAAAGAPRDAIDALAEELDADWVELDAAINEQLLAAAQASTDAESLRAAVIAAVEKLDTAELQARLALARTKAHVGGDIGGEVS